MTKGAENGEGAAPQIAIIGSGPAGCYTAQFLRKLLPQAGIVMVERLPVPFGLIRYGVAPDHPGTKAVARQFERLFQRDNVTLAANVEVGVDVSLRQLRGAFDVVVVASGLYRDRSLGTPGHDSPGVYGAGAITRFVNGHPDEEQLRPRLGRRVALIGNGNIAVDVLRLLTRPLDDFADSDVDLELLRGLRSEGFQGIEEIHVIGRSPAARAKFDVHSIRELTGFPGVRYVFDSSFSADDAAAEGVGVALAGLDHPVEGPVQTVVHFSFGWSPAGIRRHDGGLTVDLVGLEGARSIEADSVISAIGFSQTESLLSEVEASHPGSSPRVASGLYRTGWVRRGPTGTIPDNRVDAREVAEAIAEDVTSGVIDAAKPGVAGLPAQALAHAIDYAGWRAIDAAEIDRGGSERPRLKIAGRSELVRIARTARESGE